MHDENARRKAPAALKKIEKTLRDHALSYPEVTEDFPWGHSAMKVNKKAFAFISLHEDEVSISCKLPQSRDIAVDLPFTEPTHYGLGKHGWVTAHLRLKDKPPVDLVKSWIDESYRAIAPKKLVARLPIATLLLLVLVSTSFGCATAVNRRYQRVPVSTQPSDATVNVACGSASRADGVTPVTVSLSRRAMPCEVTASKAGFQSKSVSLSRRVSGAFWANLLWSATFAVLGYASGEDECDPGSFLCSTRGESAAGGAVLGLLFTGIGMAIDGATGALFAREPAEIRIELPPQQSVP